MNSKELALYWLEQLAGLEGIRARPMMGGYLFYYGTVYFGGIFEPGFMVKITPSSRRLLPNAQAMPPYPAAKELLLVDDGADRETLCAMVRALCAELPPPTPKKARKRKGE